MYSMTHTIVSVVVHAKVQIHNKWHRKTWCFVKYQITFLVVLWRSCFAILVSECRKVSFLHWITAIAHICTVSSASFLCCTKMESLTNTLLYKQGDRKLQLHLTAFISIKKTLVGRQHVFKPNTDIGYWIICDRVLTTLYAALMTYEWRHCPCYQCKSLRSQTPKHR